MKEGLLWYDDNPSRDLAEKIGRAARRYRQKFGAAPDVCYVHPSLLKGADEGQRAFWMAKIFSEIASQAGYELASPIFDANSSFWLEVAFNGIGKR